MDQKKVKVINQRQKSVKANDSSRNKELLGYVCPLIERRVKKKMKLEPEMKVFQDHAKDPRLDTVAKHKENNMERSMIASCHEKAKFRIAKLEVFN